MKTAYGELSDHKMTKIYYFSGTGNSLWSAKKIAQGIGEPCELFNIGSEVDKEEIILEADAVIFVFPSYAFGLPLVVRKFVKKAQFKTQYIASFVTYGSFQGGTLAEMRRILNKKKLKNCYYGKIAAVENYLILFGHPSPEIKEKRLSMQRKDTEEAIRCIIGRKINRIFSFRPFSIFISWLFTFGGLKLFYKFYKTSDKCNGCGKCEKLCPVSAITMKNKRPVFSKKCEHCQGCINICPLRAIHYLWVKESSVGYTHPEISF